MPPCAKTFTSSVHMACTGAEEAALQDIRRLLEDTRCGLHSPENFSHLSLLPFSGRSAGSTTTTAPRCDCSQQVNNSSHTGPPYNPMTASIIV